MEYKVEDVNRIIVYLHRELPMDCVWKILRDIISQETAVRCGFHWLLRAPISEDSWTCAIIMDDSRLLNRMYKIEPKIRHAWFKIAAENHSLRSIKFLEYVCKTTDEERAELNLVDFVVKSDITAVCDNRIKNIVYRTDYYRILKSMKWLYNRGYSVTTTAFNTLKYKSKLRFYCEKDEFKCIETLDWLRQIAPEVCCDDEDTSIEEQAKNLPKEEKIDLYISEERLDLVQEILDNGGQLCAYHLETSLGTCKFDIIKWVHSRGKHLPHGDFEYYSRSRNMDKPFEYIDYVYENNLETPEQCLGLFELKFFQPNILEYLIRRREFLPLINNLLDQHKDSIDANTPPMSLYILKTYARIHSK